MSELMASARRIRACDRGQRADRIPIATPIPWHPMASIDAERLAAGERRRGLSKWRGSWSAIAIRDPRVVPLSRRVSLPAKLPAFHGGAGRVCRAVAEERVTATRKRVTTICHAPKGDLRWVYDEEDGIETRWDMVKPINSLEDVDRLLSVPWRMNRIDPRAFEPHRQNRAKMGENAIGGGGVNSMVAMLCGVMHYEQMLEWLLSETSTIKLLADTWLQRTSQIVDYMLDQGVGPFWHFNGVERACPPMMSPAQWEKWVVPYDGAIMKQIKARDPEARIHVHCHAKVGTLLKSFMAMGVDSTDPVEPLPQGDISFADARRIVGDRMVLHGNIEFSDMEDRRPSRTCRRPGSRRRCRRTKRWPRAHCRRTGTAAQPAAAPRREVRLRARSVLRSRYRCHS